MFVETKLTHTEIKTEKMFISNQKTMGVLNVQMYNVKLKFLSI